MEPHSSSQPKRILIFQEDPEMQTLLSEQLKGAGAEIHVAATLTEALKILITAPCELLLTEARVPESTLSQILNGIRTHPEINRGLKILVLADAGMEAEGLKGSEGGCDEVLIKPFDRSVLQAKVRELLSRFAPRAGQLSLGKLVLDLKSYDVFSSGGRIHLTPNEFKLLEALLEVPGQILSREQLIARVQGAGISVVDRAIDTHVFSLRKKLGADGELIETVRGLGYRINEKPIPG